jgi:hypothetical protein
MRLSLAAAAVILAGLLSPVFGADPAKQPPPKKPPHDKLPATMHWDVKNLAGLGTIVTTEYDKKNERIVWTIETKKFVEPNRIAPLFYDDEGSPLLTGHDLVFKKLPPDKDDKRPEKDKKERVQAILRLPGNDILKETFRVVLHKFD